MKLENNVKLGAGICAIYRDKFLVGMRQVGSSEHGTWCTPGGKFEKDLDKSFKDCAIREFFEETGIVLNPDDVYHMCNYQDKLNRFIFANFYVKLDSRPEIKNWDKSETVRFEWCKVREMRSNMYLRHYGLNYILPMIEKLIYPTKDEQFDQKGYDSIYKDVNKFYGVSLG